MTTTTTQPPDDAAAAAADIVTPIDRYAAPDRRWRGATPDGVLVYGETPGDVREALQAHYAAVKARLNKHVPPSPPKPTRQVYAPPLPAPAMTVTLPAEPTPTPTPAPAPTPEPPATMKTIAAKMTETTRARDVRRKARRREYHAARGAKLTLHPHIRRDRKLRQRIKAILDAHGVTWAEIVGESRSPLYLRPRLEVYRLLTADGWSRSEVARAVKRDHTTIFYYINKWGLNDD